VSGSGISWAICKSASCSGQITMPAPHCSVFYRPDALPAAQPTASKHWRQRCYVSHVLLLLIFFDPGTQFPGNEKITLCNTKKYKNQAEPWQWTTNLTPPPPSQNYYVVRWHCTTESTCLLLFLLSVHHLGGLRLCPAFWIVTGKHTRPF